MADYRIYPLNPAGRVGRPFDAQCMDDAAAIVAAQDLDDQVRDGCEIWQQTRFVGRFHFAALAR